MDTVDERVDTGTNNSQTNFLAPEKKINSDQSVINRTLVDGVKDPIIF